VVIQFVAGLRIIVVEMSMSQVHRNLSYDTWWWLQYVAQMRNLLAPYYVIYVDTKNWNQDDSLFDGLHRLSAQGEVQFKQHLGILLGPATVDLSSQSTAYLQGSSRL
jgi:hypothetical protein